MRLKTIVIFTFLLHGLIGGYSSEDFLTLRKLDWEQVLASRKYDESHSLCAQHLSNYTEGIMSFKSWALTMLDASAKIPEGILNGNKMILGNFDECIAVEDPEIEFTGQHCMADLTLSIPLDTIKYSPGHRLRLPESTHERAGGTGFKFFYGVCVPSNCSAEDLNVLLNTSSTPILKALTFNFTDENCRTKEPKELNTRDKIVIGFLAVMAGIALLSTAYEVERCMRNANAHPLLTAFSLYKNGKALFGVSKGEGQMLALHGMRALSMAWVVLCHAYFVFLFSPTVNLGDLLDMVQSINRVILINGFVAVDSFFFLSGLLVSFVFFRDIGRKSSYDVPLSYLHRYLRLTPLYGVMILLQITIFNHFGDGPLYNHLNNPINSVCEENWWSGMLYVQNYVTPNSTCLGQSWYLSADMQLYWISPFLLYPLLLLPPLLGGMFISIVIVAWVALTFNIDYTNNFSPNLVLTPGPRQTEFDYTTAYTRAGPWLVGLTLGYVICGLKAKKIKVKMPKIVVVLGWLTSAGLCLGVLYGIRAFNDIPATHTRLEAACYLVLHRLGWGLGLSWVVFACIHGYGGIANTFLSWGFFQPLSKLSYSTFLIHMSIQYVRMGNLRTNVHMSDLEAVYNFIGDWVLANLASIPMTLLFELPIANIDRYVFKNARIFPYPRKKKGVKNISNNNAGGSTETGITSVDDPKSVVTIDKNADKRD